GWVRPSTRDVGGNSGEGRPLPELVESELQQRGFHNVHVINGGVPSHVSGQELATIVYRVVDLKPDLIVMYDGGNDILSPYDDDPRPGYPFNFMVSERNPLLQNGARYPLFSLMAFKSELLRTLLHPYFVEKFTRRSDFRKQSGYETESWREEIAKNYVRNLVKAQTISRAFGAEFIAFFQPLAFFARPDCETPLGRHALKVREHISREMRRAREIHSLNVVDLSELFKNETDEIFGDPIHIKDASNKAVARTIAAHLSPLIKKIRR
ncbi:MAG TPA: SGNH/GDSL hydrolase family protein, partial [Elusimicrobiota bacterium]|nr:SGNH/GDSL hydrolase family protein [Elusimicrobiota bacterium]